MKICFLIPVLADCDIEKQYDSIKEATRASKVDFDIIFLLNGDLYNLFTKVRSTFLEVDNVRAIKILSNVNEHKLITVGMKYCEDYAATIIYSAKEEINTDVVKSFITSWKAGNKMVYLRKVKTGFAKITSSIKKFFYNLGIKILNIYKDFNAENDIQLLDNEVVKTINQLPAKNRQLRILDSFVGYNTDVISIISEEKKENDIYKERPKEYKFSLMLAITAITITLATFLIFVLDIAFGWKFGLGAELLLLFIILVGGIFSIVFSTKSALAYRVGDQVDVQEITDITNKAEKYNFKKV